MTPGSAQGSSPLGVTPFAEVIPGKGPVTWHLGPVQHSPVVYPVFWGKHWKDTTKLEGTNCGTEQVTEKCTAVTLRKQIMRFYNNVGNSLWERILTQYYDATEYISPQVTVASPCQPEGCLDETQNSPEVNAVNIEKELERYATEKGWALEGMNNQFIFLPDAKTPFEQQSSFTASTTTGSTVLSHVSNFANVAVGQALKANEEIPPSTTVAGLNKSAGVETITMTHAATGKSEHLAVIGEQYEPCGYHQEIEGIGTPTTFTVDNCGTDHVASTNVASHEFAESLTDPFGAGWFSPPTAPKPGEEVADVCNGNDKWIVEAEWQYIWDDAQGGCTFEGTEGHWGPYPPRVEALSPAASHPGATVTVMGANFVHEKTTVNFGATPASSVKVLGPGMLEAVVPPGSKEVPVTVATTEYGTSAQSPADVFTYTQPIVTQIGPSEGLQAGGTQVTISGENLGNAETVEFGSEVATVLHDTPTSITAEAPSGSGRVDVTVRSRAGVTSETGPADVFTYFITGPYEGFPVKGEAPQSGPWQLPIPAPSEPGFKIGPVRAAPPGGTTAETVNIATQEPGFEETGAGVYKSTEGGIQLELEGRRPVEGTSRTEHVIGAFAVSCTVPASISLEPKVQLKGQLGAPLIQYSASYKATCVLAPGELNDKKETTVSITATGPEWIIFGGPITLTGARFQVTVPESWRENMLGIGATIVRGRATSRAWALATF
jgi:hypothetical protein